MIYSNDVTIYSNGDIINKEKSMIEYFFYRFVYSGK